MSIHPNVKNGIQQTPDQNFCWRSNDVALKKININKVKNELVDNINASTRKLAKKRGLKFNSKAPLSMWRSQTFVTLYDAAQQIEKGDFYFNVRRINRAIKYINELSK